MEMRRSHAETKIGSAFAGTSAASYVTDMSASQEYEHLPKAPIVEAVVDWRSKLSTGFNISRLKEEAQKVLAPRYRFLDELRGFEFGIQTGLAPQVGSHDLGVHGYRFRSEDERQIATLKREGFSFSRLKPYTQWSEVFAEAERLWKIYVGISGPEEVSRVAVRYINRILLPLPISDFGRYLRAPLPIPPDIPELITSFLFRSILQDPATGVAVNLTQVVEGQPDGGQLPFILDIDAYIMKNMEPNAPEVTGIFATLREAKNRLFFASLTDETIHMFR